MSEKVLEALKNLAAAAPKEYKMVIAGVWPKEKGGDDQFHVLSNLSKGELHRFFAECLANWEDAPVDKIPDPHTTHAN